LHSGDQADRFVAVLAAIMNGCPACHALAAVTMRAAR
jgi:hypothetical protein